MLKEIQNVAFWILILALVFMTLLAVLSIWDVFGDDVFWKAMATLAVITFSSGVTMIVAKNIERGHHDNNQNPPPTA